MPPPPPPAAAAATRSRRFAFSLLRQSAIQLFDDLAPPPRRCRATAFDASALSPHDASSVFIDLRGWPRRQPLRHADYCADYMMLLRYAAPIDSAAADNSHC